MPDQPDDRDRRLSREEWERYEAELSGGTGGTPGRDTAPGTPAGASGGTAGDAPAGHHPADQAGQETAPEAGEWAAPSRVLVDSPEAQRDTRPGLAELRAAKRRPIVPPWLRSRSSLRDTTRLAVGLAAHYGLYHVSRTPKYAGKLVGRAPVGLSRLLRGWLRWLLDLEGEPVRAAVVRREDADAYRHLSRQRDRRVRWRAVVTGVLLVGLAAAAVVVALAPSLGRLTSLAAAVGVLGWLGQPADKPLLDVAVQVPTRFVLTSDLVTRALAALGITAITQALAKDAKALERAYVTPIHRDGPGYVAEIDLPLGATAGDVLDKREELAANLRRPIGCVWPSVRHEVHPGRLVLWVGYEDMATTRQAPWPLAKAGTVDLFRWFPYGTDQRGRVVPLTLMGASMVIGAVPRMGKTAAARLIALAAALDPLVQLHLYDLKGTGDLRPLEPVAHRYRAGDDDRKGDVEYALADLRELGDELRRRADIINDLPEDLCPESKVTPELVRMRSYRLHPIVLIVDECQRWFEHAEHGKELETICTDLAKRGPALGIIAIFCTQRPDDKSLPSGIKDNAVLRFCLKVTGWRANNMVLGDGTYAEGIRATMFRRSDLGIGYLVGEGNDPVIVRTYYVDRPAAKRIVGRAHAMRQAAGTLSGHALGDGPQLHRGPATDLLADLLAVVPASQEKVWNQTAVARLAELRPEVYGGWKAETLTAALKPFGVATRDTWGRVPDGEPDAGRDANRKGFTRNEIADAYRNRRPTDPEEGAA